MSVSVKRVYEAAKEGEYRILVDRLWPRGLTKERAAIDAWFKDVAPSSELRAWFGHKPERFAEFRDRYRAELEQNPSVKILEAELHKHPNAVLLYGAKDTLINHAVVLKEHLEQ